MAKKNTTTNRKANGVVKMVGKVITKKFGGKQVEMYQFKNEEKELLIEAVLTLSKTGKVKVYSHNEIKAFGDAIVSKRAKEFRPFQYHVELAKFNEVCQY